MRVMLRTAAIVPFLILLAIPAMSQPRRIGREQTITKTTRSGQPVRIFTYASWHRDCRPYDAPQIVVRAQPEHGAVRLEPGSVEITVVREGIPDCSGRTYPGTQVIYTPQPGYRGPDRFEYDILVAPSPRHDTAVVDVR